MQGRAAVELLMYTLGCFTEHVIYLRDRFTEISWQERERERERGGGGGVTSTMVYTNKWIELFLVPAVRHSPCRLQLAVYHVANITLIYIFRARNIAVFNKNVVMETGTR